MNHFLPLPFLLLLHHGSTALGLDPEAWAELFAFAVLCPGACLNGEKAAVRLNCCVILSY